MTVSLSAAFSPKKRRSAAVGSFDWKRTWFAVTQTWLSSSIRTRYQQSILFASASVLTGLLFRSVHSSIRLTT